MTAVAAVGGKRPFIMRKGISRVEDLANGSSALGALMAAGGNWYYCNPTNGSAGGDGLTPETACSNLLTVYNKCRDGYNDGVLFIGGATAYNPAALFDWSNDYCHLIGISGDFAGQGARCRVVALAATALTQAMTISGDGCVIANMQFNNEKASGASGSLVLSGARIVMHNCFIMNPTSVTAAGWALKTAGEECVFYNCSIGQCSSNVRNAATYGLWMHTDANSNKFIGCEFKSWSDLTTHDLVFIDAITSEGWTVQFEDCLFQNLGNASLAAAIDDDHAEEYHQIIFRGRNNAMVQITAASTVLGSAYVHDQTATVSGLLHVIVAES